MHLHLIDRKTAIKAGLRYFFDGTPCSKGEISERLASNGRCFCEKHRKIISRSASNWHAKKAEKILVDTSCSKNQIQAQIISRESARLLNMKCFFSGLPCERGNIALRLVSNNTCTCGECASIRAAHRRKSYQANRDANLRAMRNYYILNREKENQRAKSWKDRNRHHLSEYQKAAGDKRAANESMRRSRKYNATPSWFDDFDELVFAEAFQLCRIRKKETGIDWHVDHMIPLQAKKACGLHIGINIQVIPATMNVRKHNKLVLIEPLQWLRQ